MKETVMAEAFDVLPGILLPVREVTSRLASMWETDGPYSLLEFRASQMNVILHLGLAIDSEYARERFDGLIRFAQRYPCRIIVLCPTSSDRGNGMESKLFSQCYIGKSHREMCCCEALILRYNFLDTKYLFDQVSVWLEGDLPTYYWLSEVSLKQAENYLKAVRELGVQRVVFDRSDELSELPLHDLPDKYPMSDLAEAGLLPLQQVIGQFLGRYSVSSICDGLKSIRVCDSGASGEGRSLIRWVNACLNACGKCEKDLMFRPENQSGDVGPDSSFALKVEFIYESKKYFTFERSGNGLRCELRANFGESDEFVSVPVKPPNLEQTLAETFFH